MAYNMSMVLKKSKQALKGARFYLKQAETDDAGLSWCCFMLHQSLEFTLKYMFECEGVKYPWGHDIRVLIHELRDRGVNLKIFDFIEMKAETYNSWEAESRYKDSFL